MAFLNFTQPIQKWDKAGLLLSTLCLVHCVITPIAVSALPTVAHLIGDNEWIHVFLAMLTLPVAGYAIYSGYRRHHSFVPLMFAVAGIVLLLSALQIHEPHWLEILVTSVGSAVLSIGHLANHRLTCRCCQSKV